MNLIFALTVSNQNSAQAEKLLDFIFHNGGKEGFLAIGLYTDLHDEMKSRIRISANLAFDTVEEFEVRPLAEATPLLPAISNNAFRQASKHIENVYHWPFMWLESDCVPTASDWRKKIATGYHNQPKHFFGSRMMVQPKDATKAPLYFMARVGVYPNNAASRLALNQEMFYEIASGPAVAPRLTSSKLFQQVQILTEADIANVRSDAILVHGDKHGILLKHSEGLSPKEQPIVINVVTEPQATKEPVADKPKRVTRRMLREAAAAAQNGSNL